MVERKANRVELGSAPSSAEVEVVPSPMPLPFFHLDLPAPLPFAVPLARADEQEEREVLCRLSSSALASPLTAVVSVRQA